MSVVDGAEEKLKNLLLSHERYKQARSVYRMNTMECLNDPVVIEKLARMGALRIDIRRCAAQLLK